MASEIGRYTVDPKTLQCHSPLHGFIGTRQSTAGDRRTVFRLDDFILQHGLCSELLKLLTVLA